MKYFFNWVLHSLCCCSVAKLCPALCNPMDCCLFTLFMGFSRQEYQSGVPFPFPGLSGVQLFVNSWTVAHQAPLSMRLSRQEYWSGLPFPISGDLPDTGIEPRSLTSPALVSRLFTTEPQVPSPQGKPKSSHKLNAKHF